jgi:hypothetical protein
VKSLNGMGILHKSSTTTSTLYLSYAEIGIIGALSATDPATNFLISSYCFAAAPASFTIISILFYKIMMC